MTVCVESEEDNELVCKGWLVGLLSHLVSLVSKGEILFSDWHKRKLLNWHDGIDMFVCVHKSISKNDKKKHYTNYVNFNELITLKILTELNAYLSRHLTVALS